MKKTDAQLIISAVGRAVRKLLDPLRANVTELAQKLTQAESVIAEQRETIAQLTKNLSDATVQFTEQLGQMNATLLEIKSIKPLAPPTVDEILAKLHPSAPPTLEEIASHVLRDMPTMEQVKQLVADAIPTAEEVAKLVPAPVVPTAEEVAKLVVVPSADDIAKLVPVPVVPTAAEIAKLVPMPELPTIELPELPEVPTLDQIVDGVKEILPGLIPAPLKGDAGKSITVDDVRPLIEEIFKSLPKPADGKSPTIEDVRPLFAQWVVEFERLAVDRHDKILAALPKPKDGVNGLGIEDFAATLDADAKILRLTFSREGMEPKSFEFFIPWLDHKGVHREGEKYLEGDCVTRGGSTWMAVKSEPVGIPGDGKSEDWRLIVKRGNDGRDATVKDNTPTRVRVAPRKE